MRGSNNTWILPLCIAVFAFLVTGCNLDSYRDGYYQPSSGLQATANPSNVLNGFTPSTAPMNCYGAYVPCPASMQTVVNQLFYLCTVGVQMLCDNYGRQLLPAQFCVNGTEGYTQDQVMNNCSPLGGGYSH
jgi:hypothetical protein